MTRVPLETASFRGVPFSHDTLRAHHPDHATYEIGSSRLHLALFEVMAMRVNSAKNVESYYREIRSTWYTTKTAIVQEFFMWLKGECVVEEGRFVCRCQPGWTGDDCAVRSHSHSCQSDTCLNNATCIDDDAGFTCICSHLFTGRERMNLKPRSYHMNGTEFWTRANQWERLSLHRTNLSSINLRPSLRCLQPTSTKWVALTWCWAVLIAFL